jgi:hypothetical protein
MLEGLNHRQLVAIVAALLIAEVLTAWGTIYVAKLYAIANNDPLARQGGLSEAQKNVGGVK